MTKKFSHRLLDSRLLLIAGFGSLLVLPLIAFITARGGLVQAARQSEGIRRQFNRRTQLLNELRNDLINGATSLRNYLLDPDPHAAELQRTQFLQSKDHVELLLQANELRDGGQVYTDFVAGYRQYLRAIEPILIWTPDKRRHSGYEFLREEGFIRRAEMLHLADQISVWNELQLTRGAQEIEVLFATVTGDLQGRIALFLAVGLALASFVIWRVGLLEKQASERYRIAEQAREDLRDLSAKLVGAQEDERKRISRELHDEVAQNVSAIRVGLEKLHRSLPAEALAPVAGEFFELGKLTESTLKSTRNISQLLRPSMLDDLGLVPALHWLAKEWNRRNAAIVQVEAEEDLEGLGEETRICVYRVVQEALNNAMNHGHASQVTIRALRSEGKLQVSIQDNGKSFAVEREKGMGIVGMMERVDALGGKLRIVSQAGIGTVVMAELP